MTTTTTCTHLNGAAASARGVSILPVGTGPSALHGSRVSSFAANEMDLPLGCSIKLVSRPASPGPQVTLNEFEVLDADAVRSLGKGSFGVVRRIRRKGTGDVYALKTMQKIEVVEGDLIDQVEREIQVQRTLKHENVLRLYKHFEDAETVYLLLEYCAKGELYQLLRTRRGRRFTEPVAHHYFVQVTRGLQYLHFQHIVHRDLKPENLLVDHDDVLKIADFGWCADSSVMRTTFCGTLDYLAPEMVQGHGHNHTLDIWSLGVLLFEMVVGRPPFQSTNHALLISKILASELRFPPFVSHGICDLVRRLLQKDPNDRLPLDRVVGHPWVIGSTNIANGSASRPLPDSFKSPSAAPVEVPLAHRQSQIPPATSRTASLANEDMPASSRTLQAQASPREESRGVGKSTSAIPQHLTLQHTSGGAVRPASSYGRVSRTAASVSMAQPLAVRAQPPLTPAISACRARVQHAGTRLVSQLHTSQVARYNLSAPQTPIAHAPFRSIRTAAIVRGPGCNGSAGITTAVPASTLCDSPDSGFSQARRPRSIGASQSHELTPGVRTVDLTSISTAPSQSLGTTVNSAPLPGPTAPATPAQQQRMALPRVTAVGGYPVPSSPKPCPSNRTLSPVGPPTSATGVGGSVVSMATGYCQHLNAISHTIPGIAIVRRPRSVP